MKKILTLFAVLLMAVMGIQAASTNGTFPGGGSWGFDNSTGKLVIDATTVPDYMGTLIDCSDVSCPSSVYTAYGSADYMYITTAPWSAFAKDVKEIAFVNPNLKKIGECAFTGMWRVEKVTIDYSKATAFWPLRVSNAAFAYCMMLKEFNFTHVDYIGSQAFMQTALSYIELPYVSELGDYPFAGCPQLLRASTDDNGNTILNRKPSIYFATMTLPKNTDLIGADIYEITSGKKYDVVVMFNYNVMNASGAPKAGHTNNRETVYGEVVQGDNAAYWTLNGAAPYWYINGDNSLIIDCDKIGMPNFPKAGANWSSFKSKAKEVHLYNEVYGISNNAFINFTKLEKVDINYYRSSYNYIGNSAFYNCSSLKTINMEKVANVKDSAFMGCSALQDVDLSGCVNVYQRAFVNCGIRSLRFDTELRSIKSQAFYGGIKDGAVIYMNYPTPPDIETNPFVGVNQSSITLDIPEAYGDNYNIAPWNYFKRTAVGTTLYGVFNGTAMTIYYDEKMSSRGGTQDWTTSSYSTQRAQVTKVTFDQSVLGAAPTDMNKWFSGFSSLEQIVNLDYLNTEKVTDMHELFKGCKKLKSIDLSHFNTANVYNMQAMFEDCDAVTTLNVNTFSMSKVRFITHMFYSCDNLERIYSDKSWSYLSSQMAIPDDVFTGSTKLMGGYGHKYDAKYTSMEYACPDNINYRGYFWRHDDTGDEWFSITVYYWLIDDTYATWPDGTDNWNANTINQYCSMTTSIPNIINRTTYHKKGTQIQFSNFKSDYFFMMGYWTGSDGYHDGTEFTITVNESMHVVLEVYDWVYVGVSATQSEGNYGTVSASITNDRKGNITLLEYPDKYPEDTWRMTYTAKEKSNGRFLGWIPEKWVEQYGSEEDAYRVASYLKGYIEGQDGTDALEYKLLKRFEDREFSVKPSEWLEFSKVCGITENDNSDYFVMRAMFEEKEMAKHYVMLKSDHGTIYDTNGIHKSIHMGDSCYYVAEGTTLSLDVKDVEDDWLFDHWEIDGVSEGSTCPLSYEVTENSDFSTIEAVYKKKPARFVVVARKNLDDGNWFYMTSDLGSSSTKRYQAVDAETTDISEVASDNLDDKFYWEIEGNYLKTGEKYCVYNGSSNSANLGTLNNARELTIQKTDGYYTFSLEDTKGDTRYLSLNKTTGQDYFAFYKGLGQSYKLYIIEKGQVATGIDQVSQEPKAKGQKLIIDGQLYILRDGKMYNAQGVRVQ